MISLRRREIGGLVSLLPTGPMENCSMLSNKKVCVVLPAYNAAKTLEQTFEEIPADIVDDVILIDDASADDTVAVARQLGIHTLIHDANRGYGGNQKTCYAARAGPRRRHRGDAAPRLPVHAASWSRRWPR